MLVLVTYDVNTETAAGRKRLRKVRTAIAHPFPAGFAPRSPQNKAGKLVKKHNPAP